MDNEIKIRVYVTGRGILWRIIFYLDGNERINFQGDMEVRICITSMSGCE
jgi:hypothetical protein